MNAAQVEIHQVRADCPEGTEPLHARLRLAHLLSTADFHPSGLPPQAILLLRRLRAPRPLALETYRVSVEWEQTLRGEVAHQMQRALRPERGRIPVGANAVLFTDETELLACLGLLASRPEAEEVWVWQSAVGSRSPFPNTDGLLRIWLESPRLLPAALRHLEAWNCVTSVLQIFSEPQAETLFAAIATEFNLPVTVGDLQDRREAVPPARETSSQEQPVSSTEQTPTKAESKLPPTLPDILRDLPPAAVMLSPAAQSLLTLARILTGVSSYRESLAAIKAFRTDRRIPDSAPSPPKSPETMEETSHHAAIEELASPSVPAAQPDIASIGQAEPTARTSVEDSPMARQETIIPALPEAERSEETRTAEIADTITPRESTVPWDGLEGIPTQLCGVFYLLNLFLRLDAPACFDAEFSLSDHLTLWGLTQWFGERLLAEGDNPTPTLPFARGGRQSDSPLPQEGKPSASPSLRRRGSGGGSASDAIWGLLARLDGRQPGEPIAPNLPDRERVLQTIYTRLNSQLRELLEDNPVGELLRRPGVVYVTRIHVDVVMPLDAIWLPARRAGLDASPGWIPDLLRVVLFHFE